MESLKFIRDVLALIGFLCLVGWSIFLYTAAPWKDEREITQKEYRQLVERFVRYPSYKWLIQSYLDDGIISTTEKRRLDEIYSRIHRSSSIELYIQEKAYDKSVSESSDRDNLQEISPEDGP